MPDCNTVGCWDGSKRVNCQCEATPEEVLNDEVIAKVAADGLEQNPHNPTLDNPMIQVIEAGWAMYEFGFLDGSRTDSCKGTCTIANERAIEIDPENVGEIVVWYQNNNE